MEFCFGKFGLIAISVCEFVLLDIVTNSSL